MKTYAVYKGILLLEPGSQLAIGSDDRGLRAGFEAKFVYDNFACYGLKLATEIRCVLTDLRKVQSATHTVAMTMSSPIY